MFIGTTFGGMVTYLGRIIPIKLSSRLITLHCKIIWQTKIVLSLLPQCPHIPTLRSCWLKIKGSYLSSHIILWLRGSARSHDKLKVLYSLPQCLWPLNLGGWWLTMIPIKLHDHLITCSYNITWQTKKNSLSMGSKFDRMVTYLQGLLPIKLSSFLVTFYCKIMWQIKTVISPLPQCRIPNLRKR